jgi:hypothetical protein
MYATRVVAAKKNSGNSGNFGMHTLRFHCHVNEKFSWVMLRISSRLVSELQQKATQQTSVSTHCDVSSVFRG